jgi:hypothetical protein
MLFFRLFSRTNVQNLRRFFVLFLAMTACAASRTASYAQTTHSTAARAERMTDSLQRTTWIPRGLMFRPLRANVFEARVGGQYSSQTGRLRLDIGNSTDLVATRLTSSAGEGELRVGADFFTLTRLRSEANFRFPVETTDFFFGVNASYKTTLAVGSVLAARVRLAHISAHLVDGSPNVAQSFVFSREFVDVVGSVMQPTALGDVRLYAGLNALFHTIPQEFGVFTPQLGVDLTSTIAENVSFCAGYDVKFTTVRGSTSGIGAAQAGVKFGEKYGAGLLVGVYWYDGKSLHGMFYNERDSSFGVGFQVEF